MAPSQQILTPCSSIVVIKGAKRGLPGVMRKVGKREKRRRKERAQVLRLLLPACRGRPSCNAAAAQHAAARAGGAPASGGTAGGSPQHLAQPSGHLPGCVGAARCPRGLAASLATPPRCTAAAGCPASLALQYSDELPCRPVGGLPGRVPGGCGGGAGAAAASLEVLLVGHRAAAGPPRRAVRPAKVASSIPSPGQP